MTDRLEQKHPLRGKRSFELTEDAVNVHIDMPFLNKEFTVVLSILDPEPIEQKGYLAFVSGVNREPLVEMFLDKPDPDSFRAFVARVKQAVIDEEYGKQGGRDSDLQIDVGQLQIAIEMLTTYLSGEEYTPFLDALQALKASPGDRQSYDAMFSAFNALGPVQGAVLTYAPYVGSLMSGDIPDPGGPA